MENEVQRQRAKHLEIRTGVLILQQQALQLMTDCLLYVCKSIELGDQLITDQLKATNNPFISSVRSSSGYHGLLEGSANPLFQIFQILQILK